MGRQRGSNTQGKGTVFWKRVREWAFGMDCKCPLAWRPLQGGGTTKRKKSPERQVKSPLAELVWAMCLPQ